jgi:hypothetical protein
LHATAIIRPKRADWARCGLAPSHLVSAARPFARMAVAMSGRGRNGCGSKQRSSQKEPVEVGPSRYANVRDSTPLICPFRAALGQPADLIRQPAQGLVLACCPSSPSLPGQSMFWVASWSLFPSASWPVPCRSLLGGRPGLKQTTCWPVQRLPCSLPSPAHPCTLSAASRHTERFISDRICL